MILIGLIFTVFVTIPVVIVVSVLLIKERAVEQEEPEVCGNCNNCIMDFGVWTCLNEESIYFEDAVQLDREGCSEWESDSK